MSYLRRLPIDFLKIDRSLVHEVDVDDVARAIAGAVIDMAAALHVDVVAEGIETDAQAATLTDLGCGYGQGYLFGRATAPVPPPGEGVVIDGR